ncbi:protein of unknown function (plasmid) [Candidatus Methylocalor cossyra]|uniref:Secreted protein n=1 Tax=Candidatus Methylocalor cossyra TaxID=3108543 RepID=A0ABM9NMY1_9GAMM
MVTIIGWCLFHTTVVALSRGPVTYRLVVPDRPMSENAQHRCCGILRPSRRRFMRCV